MSEAVRAYILKDFDDAFFINTLSLNREECWNKLELMGGNRIAYQGKCVEVLITEPKDRHDD